MLLLAPDLLGESLATYSENAGGLREHCQECPLATGNGPLKLGVVAPTVHAGGEEQGEESPWKAQD